MGCEFEIVLWGRDREFLIAAAEEAFEEVTRLEEQLSVFIPTSEISYINAVAASEPVRVEPRLFRLLQTCLRISDETAGAFDIATGALVKLWANAVRTPDDEQLRSALDSCGYSNVILNEGNRAIRFAVKGLTLNLGAIGKGYAASRVVEVLVDRGIENALVAAGISSIYALGSAPDDDAWTVGIRHPVKRDERLTSVRLGNRAISTSGSHERFVELDGRRHSHIVDPRTGRPADQLLLTCAVTDDPAESDALSTAFFVMGRDSSEEYCRSHAEIGAIIVSGESEAQPEIVRINA